MKCQKLALKTHVALAMTGWSLCLEPVQLDVSDQSISSRNIISMKQLGDILDYYGKDFLHNSPSFIRRVLGKKYESKNSLIVFSIGC
jgi:hypothetical protein